MSGYLDHALLGRLSNIPLEARQGMYGTVSGRHRSVHRGSSVEFAEYRKYVPGDDTKRLDWKAFARSDRFFVKEFEADTNLRAYMLIDASGSMGFRAGEGDRKYDRACRIAANLAYVAIGQGDAVGAMFSRQVDASDAGQGCVFVPPSRRQAQMRLLLQQMDTIPVGGETSLIGDMHELAERIPRRGMVMVFSDLFVEGEELSEALQHLRFRKHDVAVFHLVDEIEINLDIDRPIRFVDMEGRTSVISEPALIRDEYLEALRAYLSETRRICHDSRADYFLVRDIDSWQDTATRFLMGRVKKKK